mgnify:CR=1 FL=1
MTDQPKIKILCLDGKTRLTTKVEDEKLRGIDWGHLQHNHKGQILWGTRMNVKFVSFDKSSDTANLTEITKDELEAKKLEEHKEEPEPKKELSPKPVTDQAELEQRKKDKVKEYEGVLQEVKEFQEWKELENEFTVKFVSGVGVYFLVASKKDKDLMFNICVESGWISYKELDSKTKTFVRKYDPVCKGKMGIPDYKKSLSMIKKEIEFKVNLNRK